MERMPIPKIAIRNAQFRAMELADLIVQIRRDNMLVYVTETGNIAIINSDINRTVTQRKGPEGGYDPYYYMEIPMPRCMSMKHNDFNIIQLEGNILSCADAPVIKPIPEALKESCAKEVADRIHLDLNQIVWVIGDDGKPMSTTISDVVLLEMKSSQTVDMFTSYDACAQVCNSVDQNNKNTKDEDRAKIDSFIKQGFNTPFGAYKSHRYSEKPMDYQNKTIADSISDGDRDPINRDGGENNGKR